MIIEIRLDSYFRQTVGEKRILREFRDNETAINVLLAIESEYPTLEGEIIDNGKIRPEISVLKNGQELHDNDLNNELADGDQIRVFPPIQGGSDLPDIS